MIARAEPRNRRGIIRIVVFIAAVLAGTAVGEDAGTTEPTVPELPDLAPELLSILDEPAGLPAADSPLATVPSVGEGPRTEAGASSAPPASERAFDSSKTEVAPDPEEMPLFVEEEKPPGEQKAQGKDLNLGWMVASAAFWLGVVLMVICGLLWAVKRFFPAATASFRTPAAEVLGRTLLDARKCLYVVKVGRRVVVVGSTPETLATLCEVTEPEEVDAVVALAVGDGASPPPVTFKKAIEAERSQYGVAAEIGGADAFVAGEDLDGPGGGGDPVSNDEAMSRIRGQVLRIKQKLQDLREAS